MTNETNSLGSIFDFQEKKYTDKKFVFILTDQNTASSYADGKTKRPTKAFPGFFNLKLESEVFHNGRRRIIRHVKGEQSIFKDEQTPDDKITKILTILQWVDGIRIVEGNDVQMIEYLMTTDENLSKPGRNASVKPWFQLLDMGSNLEKEMKKDMKLTELKQWCYSGPWDEVAAYARVMNVSLGQDPNQIRMKMRQLAETDPIRFEAGMKSGAALRKHYVMEAIDNEFIKKDPNSNTLLWDNGTILIQAPMGIDPVDYFVDHATTTGSNVYEYLMEKLGKKAPKAQVFAPVPETITAEIKTNVVPNAQQIPVDKPQITIPSTGITMNQAQEILKVAEEAKVITRYGKSTLAFDLEGPKERKFVGTQKVLTALKEEPEFLALVKEKLGIQ